MRIHRLAPLALILVTPPPATAGSRLPLTVRLYDMSGDRTDRSRALDAAARALAPASVEVRWHSLPTQGAAETQDEGPMPQDLVVRLVRQEAVTHRPGQLALGYAVVDAAGRRGTVATIFLERVEWLAGISGADVDELTGLAIAHEIGHLLIGSPKHTSHGLMRARWTTEEIHAGRPVDWQLGHRESNQLRAGLAARLGTRAPDGPRLATLRDFVGRENALR